LDRDGGGGGDAVGDGGELVFADVLKAVFGRLTVYGIEHYLSRTYLSIGFDKCRNFVICGVVDALAVVFASRYHRLDNGLVAKLL
jgi:hypothetical protein